MQKERPDPRFLMLGNTLSETSRAKLQEWMMSNKVADNLLRSILPAEWSIADRSGAGGHGSEVC